MAKMCQEAMSSRCLISELARFVTGTHVCRRRAFSLSALGPHPVLTRAVRPMGSDGGWEWHVYQLSIVSPGYSCFPLGTVQCNLYQHVECLMNL